MSEGWKKVKFSELFNNPKKAIISGPFGSNLKSAEYQSEGVPLVRLQNVDRWKFIDKNIIYITTEKAKELSSHSYKAGDILISKLGAPLGKACIAPESTGEGIVLADIVRVRVDENSHDKDFIVYQLNSEDISIQLRALTTGATRPRVTLKSVRELNFIVPPLSQQKHIVATLDKAFAAIDTAKANAEQNLKNAKELFESYLQNVFENKGDDWEEKTLKDVCESISAGGDKPKELSRFKTEKHTIPIYANGEKNKGLYGFTNIAKILEPSITISGRGTIGYSEIRNEPFTPIVRLIVLLPKKEKIDINFLKYIISNIDFINTGSSIPQLTVPMVKEYKITYPEIKVQNDIVQKLDALSSETKKLEAIYTQKIADLEEMKKSVLQKAFSGQLNTIN
jgi:type I restriction enzyme S subunit